MCDGLAARGCTCPALGVLPEGCVENASNSYALKLRVLVSVVVCSTYCCGRLHGQLEVQVQRRGYSAEPGPRSRCTFRHPTPSDTQHLGLPGGAAGAMDSFPCLSQALRPP